MAKPNEPKETKPKVEDKEKKGIDTSVQMVLINIASTILICILFLTVNYFLQSNMLKNIKLNTTPAGEETAEGEEGGEDVQEAGIILDLGDFILNLTDVNARKYLKVNVALEVTKSAEDKEAEAALASTEGGGGHGGHGGGEVADPNKAIVERMEQFKPSIRDAIITTLSSKTSAELATVPGKELAKEQIIENVNAIFAGEREVLRVNFGQFIIQ